MYCVLNDNGQEIIYKFSQKLYEWDVFSNLSFGMKKVLIELFV